MVSTFVHMSLLCEDNAGREELPPVNTSEEDAGTLHIMRKSVFPTRATENNSPARFRHMLQ